ncbi:hypothetical protein [Stutzerimonas stutzeri]|uniref:Uncharacterized protein n=1 Tax=Stutzerimonas stutzeri TaxID=316 RepID=A0AA40RV79_STUST|nr:hypothetical protein [Stutzerimonas stutzeri]MBA1306621.1 hypothetical protein [Stutzerimonas stutzeri]
MKAQLVADKLLAKGCSFSSVVEPSPQAPGSVRINDQIHVEVPLEGDVLLVVMKQPDGSFVYGRPRKRIGYVELDISCAIHQGWPRP